MKKNWEKKKVERVVQQNEGAIRDDEDEEWKLQQYFTSSVERYLFGQCVSGTTCISTKQTGCQDSQQLHLASKIKEDCTRRLRSQSLPLLVGQPVGLLFRKQSIHDYLALL
jgi:hypothetical protein